MFTRSTNRRIVSGLAGPLGLLALATPATVIGEVRSAWRASTFDLDGDGYADWQANRSELEDVSAPGGVVPSGWVEKRGDFDDNDPDVHPRRPEGFCNGIDDDCDGRVDEPEIQYYPSGNASTTDGFTMLVKVNDADVVSVWNNRNWRRTLYYEVEWENLNDTGARRTTGAQRVTSMAVWPSSASTSIRLTGLSQAQVYRARVQFRAGPIGATSPEPIGEKSNWYYTTTEGVGDLAKARTRAVLRGLYEYYLSEHLGYVGYLGQTYEYGTRYGADAGEAWCSEYYAYTIRPEVSDPLENPHVYQVLIDYFTENDAYTSVADPDDFINDAHRGDYLAVYDGNGDISHSCMFLAYDADTQKCWTLNGNGTGIAEWEDTPYAEFIGTGYESRCGGDEVSIFANDPGSDIAGWGELTSAMLD